MNCTSQKREVQFFLVSFYRCSQLPLSKVFCSVFQSSLRKFLGLLATLLGAEHGCEYDEVSYIDKEGVEHEVKKEEPYH